MWTVTFTSTSNFYFTQLYTYISGWDFYLIYLTLFFVFKGFRTLEDIRTKATLTHTIKIGLKHYDDFLDRMPRSEAAAIEKTVCTSELDVNYKERTLLPFYKSSMAKFETLLFFFMLSYSEHGLLVVEC